MCRRSEIYSAAASGTYKSVPRFTNKELWRVCEKERHTHEILVAWPWPTDCPSDQQNARSTLIFHQYGVSPEALAETHAGNYV
jgi:hypothetical protein